MAKEEKTVVLNRQIVAGRFSQRHRCRQRQGPPAARSCLLLSCFLEGHLDLCRVSNAAIYVPSPQISLWAACSKLRPKQRKFAVYANYRSLWCGFFSYAQVPSVTVLFICVKVYLRGSAVIDVGE